VDHDLDQPLMDLQSCEDQVLREPQGAAEADDRDKINVQFSALRPSSPYFSISGAQVSALPGLCAQTSS
jgi:hypothetical protein